MKKKTKKIKNKVTRKMKRNKFSAPYIPSIKEQQLAQAILNQMTWAIVL